MPQIVLIIEIKEKKNMKNRVNKREIGCLERPEAVEAGYCEIRRSHGFRLFRKN